jgi:S-formylglutathione hydrolase FrmB
MPRTIARVFILFAVTISVALGATAQELELTTIEFHSASVDRMTKYNILLPRDYEQSTDRYPVLYLLHGLTQNYTAWGLSNGAPFYTGLYDDVIVVMPDAGNSWYTNYEESADGQTNNWADHIVQDVVNHVDWNFRTIARREGRAITGLSMGGYGAIMLGLRNPDMFISIGSTSGALEFGRQAAARLRGEMPPSTPQQRTPEEQTAYDARQRQPNPLIGLDGFNTQIERNPSGERHATAAHADSFDPFHLIEQVPVDQLPHIYIDCGTEDELIAGAKELTGILIEKGVPFDYMQMGGAHNAAYWIQSIGHIMSVQYEVMQRALGQRPSGQRRTSTN